MPDATEPIDFGVVQSEERAYIREARDRDGATEIVDRGFFRALCLSGGGIRSATFNLGLLQALARKGRLDAIDYLSTVSGGGYIGAWLSAWICRSSPSEVFQALGAPSRTRVQNAAPGQDEPLTFHEPPPVEHLRRYSNYLSPRLGLMSGDSLALIGIYLRNLILNWLMIVPLLAATLLVSRCVYEIICTQGSCIGGGIMLWLMAAGGVGMFMWHSIRSLDRAALDETKFGQSAFLLNAMLPLFLSAIAATVASWWCFDRAKPRLPDEMSPWLQIANITLIAGPSLWLGSQTRRTARSRRAAVLTVTAIAAVVLFASLQWLHIRFLMPLMDACMYTCFAPPLFLCTGFVVITYVVGVTSRTSSDAEREWWSRASGWLLGAATMWLVLSTLSLYGAALFNFSRDEIGEAVSKVSIGAAFTAVITWLAKRAPSPAGTQPSSSAALGARLLPFAGMLAIAFILLVLAAIIETLLSSAHISRWPLLNTLLWILFFVGAACTAAWFIDINKFSLHATYRNRLIRAYLGASHIPRQPNPFTGFDEGDNVRMFMLATQAPAAAAGDDPDLAAAPEGRHHQRPFHIVNTALNLVKSGNLAWQQRKAASFTISPLHCGSATSFDRGACGFRPTIQYYGGNPDPNGDDVRRPIQLGTAVTISGAAVSPNQGYHSDPALTFLLAFFNVRLGAWVGNPARDTYHRRAPRWALKPMLSELFGFTNEKSDYLYLSDGGHFENLGIFEMVRRKCRRILVSDAGCDPGAAFTDLGNAMRKIRTDLGVHIVFADPFPIAARSKKGKGAHCFIGVVHYGTDTGAPFDENVDGLILYVKASYYNKGPMDVCNYANANQQFPHETTADQFFSESQFESYRALGAWVGIQIATTPSTATGTSPIWDDFPQAAWKDDVQAMFRKFWDTPMQARR